jgi:cytochrome oxidase assembly protein ShyY1
MLLLHLLTAAAVTAATLLGLWQLDAWQAHREARTADLADADPVALSSVMAADDPFPAGGAGRPVRFSGRWLPADTVYVERGRSGRSGYWVVTPVSTCPASADAPGCPAVLVVRGWSASHPAPPPEGGAADVTGWLQPGESAGGDPAESGSDVVPSLRVSDVLQRMDRDLYGGYVIAGTPAGPGLEPVTPESLPDPPRFTAVRNLVYALEWWVFGLFAAFLWLRWCRDELAVEEAGPAPDEAASDRPVPSAP